MPVIQLDIDPDELGRNYPNTISCRRREGVAAAADRCGQRDAAVPHKEWTRRIAATVREYWAEHEPFRTSDAVPIRPERICKGDPEVAACPTARWCRHVHSAIWTAQHGRFTHPASDISAAPDRSAGDFRRRSG